MDKFLIGRPSDGKLVSKRTYLEYLKLCAEQWEHVFHDPEQAAWVRAKAERIRAA